MCPIPEDGDTLPPAMVVWTLLRVAAPATLDAEMPAAALRAQDPLGSQEGRGSSGNSPLCPKAQPSAQS